MVTYIQCVLYVVVFCSLYQFRNPDSPYKISWIQAEAICKRNGGTLASISTKYELDTVRFHFQHVASIYGQFVYIGLRTLHVSIYTLLKFPVSVKHV